MPRKQRTFDRQPQALPEHREFGSFKPGGGYREHVPGKYDPLTRAVLDVFSARRLSRQTPAQIAALIRVTPEALPAFSEHVLVQWETLTDFDSWFGALVYGSASGFIKYEGNPLGVWAGGRHVNREQVIRDVPMTDEEHAEANEKLRDALGALDTKFAKRFTGDREAFRAAREAEARAPESEFNPADTL
jgi:hypothetical protein